MAAMKSIERPIVAVLLKRFRSPGALLQVVLGPRQVGKTTALQQVIARWPGPSHYASADLPAPPGPEWVQGQWQVARHRAKETRKKTLLVLDEVQKVTRWSEVVKALHDEDRRAKTPIRVAILGSSSLHVERGAQESLAGRFEQHFVPHWSFSECRAAFRWSLEQWIYFGGYPGAAAFARDQARWRSFVSDSLIEAVLSRDVLQMAPVQKPALLRQLFMLAVRSPAQVISFNKMLGQLQDAGNTVTLAHYLDLLSSAFLVSGLDRWTGGTLRSRASSPKLVVWNNAILNALSGLTFAETRRRPDWWGRLVENAVGAHLLNHGLSRATFYWQEAHAEVDYVVERGRSVTAFEVKSGRTSTSQSLDTFRRRAPRAKILTVGTGGIPLEEFFSSDPASWL